MRASNLPFLQPEEARLSPCFSTLILTLGGIRWRGEFGHLHAYS